MVRMGGRIAEELVFGVVSTGANNDLVGSTELARKMVREWGMSERIGPMAWGNQGQVFLGEDLMHTRDYSDDTARIIDEEVEQILRDQEQRCRETLTEHRNGLDLVARALLEHETIDGAEVHRLIGVAANGHAGNRSGDGSGGSGDRPAPASSRSPSPRTAWSPRTSPEAVPGGSSSAVGRHNRVGSNPAPGPRPRRPRDGWRSPGPGTTGPHPRGRHR